jgi:hypothetical protein
VVSLPCRRAGTSRARRRPVTRTSGVAAERKREKVGAAVAAEGKGKKRGGAKRSGERCGVSGERRNKGKLTSGPRLSAAPGGRRGDAVTGASGWAGRGLGRVRFVGKGEGVLGWAVLAWAGHRLPELGQFLAMGPKGFRRIVFGFEFEWPIQIQIPLN